jgi:hypothetical protein
MLVSWFDFKSFCNTALLQLFCQRVFAFLPVRIQESPARTMASKAYDKLRMHSGYKLFETVPFQAALLLAAVSSGCGIGISASTAGSGPYT